MTTKQMLQKRLKHQMKEVEEAKKKLGEPGFPKSYLNRMVANCRQTKNLLSKCK